MTPNLRKDRGPHAWISIPIVLLAAIGCDVLMNKFGLSFRWAVLISTIPSMFLIGGLFIGLRRIFPDNKLLHRERFPLSEEDKKKRSSLYLGCLLFIVGVLLCLALFILYVI